ncbi:MAG TPA: hypothetical protein VG388_13545 [Solirubrobacteraceae bacterium]|nr:hypothetical protein [Solirubrobacteraceae bacterium]
MPFEEKETPVAVLYKHVHERIAPVGSVAPDVDPRIEAWLERVRAKDPADRSPDARSVRAHGRRPRAGGAAGVSGWRSGSASESEPESESE